MKWIKCVKKYRNGTYDFTNPTKSDDYWVTDGYYVHMAHFDLATGDWGIYQPNEASGIIRHCYCLDDMNFSIVAYAEMESPKGFERFQGVLF
jgi:hypothetical protein